MYTELSETDSSVLALPFWSQTTTVLKTVCMLGGSRRLVWTLSTALDETFPKEAQAGEKCFPPQKKLVFLLLTQKFSQTNKSKLFKDWVYSFSPSISGIKGISKEAML